MRLRIKREPLLLLAPAVLALAAAFAFPVGQVLWLAVHDQAGQLTVDNFRRFFVDAYYPLVAERTIRLSLIITFMTALIGVPLAYVMHRSSRGLRMVLIVVIVLPLMTSVVVRTFGWLVILGRNGLLARLLEPFGLVSPGFALMHTETGIVVAMVQVLLPFMVLTVLAAMGRIDRMLEEAARTAGAGFYATLWHVVLPLARPGIVSGALLVLALSMSSFVTPTLVGGVRLPVLAGAIYQQVGGTLDWNFAAAQAALLLLLALVLIIPYARFARGRGEA
jgi:putative spermidine/putrescine transport system permease protein